MPLKFGPFWRLPGARKREIVGGIFAAVLARDNVLYLVWDLAVSPRKVAVLAPTASPSANELARLRVDHGADSVPRPCTFSLRMLMTSETSISASYSSRSSSVSN